MARPDYASNPAFRVINGVCPHDCPDSCAWQVAVAKDTGRATDIWGHPEHPFTDGKLCTKVDNYLLRTYHADRLTTPLRRVGPKGSGRFESISWETAVEEIAGRTGDAVAEHGAETVLQYSYGGTMGIVQGEGMSQRFFNRLGATRLARTICAEAGMTGMTYTLGRTMGLDPLDFAYAKLILLWGTNTLTANMHLWPVIQRARKAGGRVVVIDPVRTRTAAAADEWIPIRPGTDAALALGMMHVIVTEGLVDQEYVEVGTVGYQGLARRAVEWTPERVEGLSGVPAQRVRTLGREYACTRPAAIRINYGLQRNRGGGMAVRTISCLPALVGAWRERGGGITLSTSGSFGLDKSSVERPDLLGDRSPRTFNMNRLGEALSVDRDDLRRAHYRPRPRDPLPEDPGPPVHALFVYNCNPAAVAPAQEAVTRGLEREDLFTVVLEHFQTDTADYADILLPATTQLEHWDLVKPYGHLYLGLNRPAIDPVANSRPNSEIFRRIARAMGFDEPCFSQGDVSILEEFVGTQTDPCMSGLTWERFLSENFLRLNLPDPYLPFAKGRFPTPSGKCEFRSEAMARDGYDALPTHTPPATADLDPETLCCISPPAHSFLNSSFGNIEKFSRREGEPSLLLHPDDARARGVADKAQVVVANERGEVQLRARVRDDVVRGTVVASSILWRKLSPGRRNINWLTSPDETDMGAGALFFDVSVTVRLA